jgi:hypothetical protein
MRVPLIGTLGANSDEIAAFPAMDASAKIRKIPSDGENTVIIKFDNVACMDSFGGRQDKVFDFVETGKNAWEVAITDSRITFWNPMVAGFFGKPKLKAGKSTAGHLYYNSIGALSAGYIDDNTPFLSCTCQRYDGALSHILMFSDIDTLKKTARELHSKISELLTTTGTSNTTENIQAWESFVDNAWKQKLNDLRATVPFVQLKQVPNGRL